MSMDIQENPTKVPLSENAILHQSGVSFFRIFTAYRKEKKIRTEKIVSGVISRRAFLDIEKGKSVLSRENWKFLMHRIGIVTEEQSALRISVTGRVSAYWNNVRKREI